MSGRERFLFICAAAVLLCGCSSEFFVNLSALDQDPSTAQPVADSFVVERQIHVSWPEDPATDTYMLYRDTTPDAADPTLIYEGTELTIVDTDVTVDQTYYYRLGKRRGQRVFTPSDPVYAVGTDVRQDQFEGNDSLEEATPFEDGLLANIHGYRDTDGRTLVDVDYYSVTVPANSRVILLFTDFENLNANELVFSLDQGVGVPLFNGQTVSISNYELTAQDFFFRLYLDEGAFFGSGLGAGGGAVVEYRIRLNVIESLA